MRTPKGVHATLYWFNTETAAEAYLQYLTMLNGIKELEARIKSPKTYLWEKADLQKFRDTLDITPLERRVRRIKFTTEEVFIDTRQKNE